MSAAPQNIAIIGAGPAGAYAAYRLTEQGHRVEVFERDNDVGGRTWTYRDQGFAHDTGAAFVTSFYDRFLSLVEPLGLSDALTPSKRQTGLSKNGKIAPLSPSEILSFVTYPHIGVIDKARFVFWLAARSRERDQFDFTNPKTLAPHDDQTVADYVSKTLSPTLLDNLMRSTLEPFWYFRAEETSAALTKALGAYAAGSDMFIVKGGIDQIVQALLRNIKVNTGVGVDRVELTETGARLQANEDWHAFDRVIVAAPGPAAHAMLSDKTLEQLDDDLARYIASSRYAANIHAAFISRGKTPPSTSSVFPVKVEPGMAVAVSYQTHKNTGSQAEDHELISVYLNDSESRAVMDLDDAALYEHCRQGAKKLGADLPDNAEPYHLIRRDMAIPMMPPGHFKAAASLIERGVQKNQRLQFCGDYFTMATIEGAFASVDAIL